MPCTDPKACTGVQRPHIICILDLKAVQAAGSSRCQPSGCRTFELTELQVQEYSPIFWLHLGWCLLWLCLCLCRGLGLCASLLAQQSCHLLLPEPLLFLQSCVSCSCFAAQQQLGSAAQQPGSAGERLLSTTCLLAFWQQGLQQSSSPCRLLWCRSRTSMLVRSAGVLRRTASPAFGVPVSAGAAPWEPGSVRVRVPLSVPVPVPVSISLAVAGSVDIPLTVPVPLSTPASPAV